MKPPKVVRQEGVEETKKVIWPPLILHWIGNFEYFIRKVLCDSPYVLARLSALHSTGLPFAADLNFKWSRRRPLGSYLGPMLHIIAKCSSTERKIWPIHTILKYLNQIGINELTYFSFSLGKNYCCYSVGSQGSFKPPLGQKEGEGWLQKWQREESREL